MYGCLYLLVEIAAPLFVCLRSFPPGPPAVMWLLESVGQLRGTRSAVCLWYKYQGTQFSHHDASGYRHPEMVLLSVTAARAIPGTVSRRETVDTHVGSWQLGVSARVLEGPADLV